MLYGREHELGILGQVVGKLADRSGTALVIRGEPGAGKTALLAEATTAARQQGSRVLSVACVRPESQIPFAALHRLLQPLLPAAAGLPDRHRSALLAAFGLSDLSADPLLTSLGALELLGGDQPTLCVVDDAQWLDDASRSVLSLVARRLTGQSCAMLVAVCDGHLARLADVGLDELPLGAIADSPARELLDSRAPGLDPALRDRVLAAAAGNPLALAELPESPARTPESPARTPERPAQADRAAHPCLRRTRGDAALGDPDSAARRRRRSRRGTCPGTRGRLALRQAGPSTSTRSPQPSMPDWPRSGTTSWPSGTRCRPARPTRRSPTRSGRRPTRRWPTCWQLSLTARSGIRRRPRSARTSASLPDWTKRRGGRNVAVPSLSRRPLLTEPPS